MQLSLRAAVAAAVSVAIARALALPYPLYAMIAAVIVTDVDPVRTRSLALPRLVGTVIGASLGAIASRWLPPGELALGVSVALSMLACHLVGRKDSATLAGYVGGIVLLEHASDPWLYGVGRLAETALGLAVAVAVSLVPKLLETEGDRR